MKNRILSCVLAIALAASTFSFHATTAAAVDAEIAPFASLYLDSYAIGITAKGNGKMTISYLVCGTRKMDKLGAFSIKIQEYISGSWYTCATYLGENNTNFYSYSAYDHLGELTYTGIPSATYRAVIVAYAELNGGSDKSLDAESNSVVCK